MNAVIETIIVPRTVISVAASQCDAFFLRESAVW
jgi:hypothetical protein